MPKNNHPANYAVTIADDEQRTYYFNDREDWESFIRSLLVGEDESRDFSTDFKVYQKSKSAWWEWQEKDFDPYDLFESIDETDFPLAHGQLLGNYSDEIDHKILWNVAQGQEGAINLIPNALTRSRVRNTYKALLAANAWGEGEEAEATQTITVEAEIISSEFDIKDLDSQATSGNYNQQEFLMNREDMIKDGDLLEQRIIKQFSLNHVEAYYVFNCEEGDLEGRLNEVLSLRDPQEVDKDEFDFELPNNFSTSNFGFGELNGLDEISNIFAQYE